MKKPGMKPGFVFLNVRWIGQLLDFLVERVPLQMGIVLLLLDALRDRLLVAIGQVAGRGLALFAGLGALQSDKFLHDEMG